MNEPDSFVLTDEDEPVKSKNKIDKKPLYKREWFLGLAVTVLFCLLILGTVHWDFDISDLKREKYSDEAIKAATATIMYSEQYFDGIITVDEACSNINKVSSRFSEYVESLGDEATWRDSTMSTNLSSIYLTISLENISGGYIGELKEDIEELKEDIKY